MTIKTNHSQTGVTWYTPTGVTWLNPAGVTWFRQAGAAMIAAVMMLAVLLVSAPPALAAKPNGGSGGGVQSCSSLSGSLALSEIRSAVGATAAQTNRGLTGAGIDVAVIDTGITEVPGLDQPGQVIDGVDLSFDGEHANLRHQDLHGHGTNMAAIIGARQTAYGSGVAPGVRLVDVKVGAADGAVDVSQVIAAVDWVVQNRNANGMNIRVLNLAYNTDSASSYVLDPLSHAIENAWRHGIVVVVAGGNDGRSIRRLGNPATNPFVIAVGAVEKKNSGWNVPSWSSTGDGVRNPDLVAPGAAVLSLGVPGSYLADTYPQAYCQSSVGTTFLRGSGTSQAAAVVSGAVALMLEANPSLTPNQVKALLKSTAGSTNSQNATQSGSGMLRLIGTSNNHAGALDAAVPSVLASAQNFTPSTGLGSLHNARGTMIVGSGSDQLTGERTAFGTNWVPAVWAPASRTGTAWSGGTWSGGTWSGGTWSGGTWSGGTWSGGTWSGGTWSGASWSGASWSGGTWSGTSWS